MTPVRYGFANLLNDLQAVAAWARRLVQDLNTRDAELERRLKDAEDRLTTGGL